MRKRKPTTSDCSLRPWKWILSKKGLRKGYVHREENLQSKVRGRISFIRNLRKNVLNKREDRNCCKFQEYTVDTPENRFLKKALLVAESQLKNIPLKSCETLFRRLGCIKSAFFEVSDDFSEYPHYAEAVRVAEMILRYFDRDMNGSSSQVHSVRPFCIDMSRLYEMYVLHLLKKAYPGKIHFQVKGSHRTQVDFVKTGEDEKIILDAKYKPRYEKGNSGIVDDVREISGYARDKKILKDLGWPDEENGTQKTANSFDPSKTVVEQCVKIKSFEGFHKIAVPLPIKGE